MKARLSIYNQVVEVFEDEKYNIDEVYPNEIIITCDDTIKPLMWYINGSWFQELEYSIPIVKEKQPLNGNQVMDILIYLGYDLTPFI